MNTDSHLKSVIGLADACELLSVACAFPSESFVQALIDGSLQADAESCLCDMGIEHTQAHELCKPLHVNESADELFEDLRKGHSFLYVRQGTGVAIFPYEGAFIHTHSDRGGTPSLFRSPITLKVEASMREAGVIPRDVRVEPCDSVWDELQFLSYVYGSQAEASMNCDVNKLTRMTTIAHTFVSEHVSLWMGDFFNESKDMLHTMHEQGRISDTCLAVYASLFTYGACVVKHMQDCQ